MTNQVINSDVRNAAILIKGLSGLDLFDVAVVLGSGWSHAADSLGALQVEIPYPEIPGMLSPIAPGQLGVLEVREYSGKRILLFKGRTHLYEGHGTESVVHSIRIAHALGVSRVLITNANGCYHPDWPIGTGVVITDHLNMSGASPLTGARFVDLQNCWDPRLARLTLEKFPALESGTYALMRGPEYQTQAEGRMLRSLGADIVGMSSILEAIAARDLNLVVFGLSVVTSSELSGVEVDPDEVVAAAEAAATRMGEVLQFVVQVD